MDHSAAHSGQSGDEKTVVGMGVVPDKVQVIPMGVDLTDNFTPDDAVLGKLMNCLWEGWWKKRSELFTGSNADRFKEFRQSS